MSEIREIIENNYKAALKERSEIKIKTYRLIKSAIKDKDISLRTGDKKQEFSDDDIMKLLQTLIKQRNESYEMYKKGGRENLASIELEEINIIKTLLPKQLDENDIRKIINDFILEKKLTSIKDMGQIMSQLKLEYSGKVDMGIAGKIAKELFQTKK